MTLGADMYTMRQRSVRARDVMRCGGFTYIGLLFLVALMGAGLVAIAQVWHIQVKRDKEAELLFIGNQFRRAISLYYERAPNGLRQYPKQLQDLLQDPRFPNVQRYLRKLYVDPMTGKPEWGLIRSPDGSILGVYSQSAEAPLKIAGFSGLDATFADAVTYREWRFAYVPTDANGLPAPRLANGPQNSLTNPQTRGPNTPMSPDPAQLQELEMAARQPGCRAQRAHDLEACGQGGGSNKDCIMAASRKYDACLGGSGQ